MAQIRLSGDLPALAAALRAAGGSLRPVISGGAYAIVNAIKAHYRSKPGKSFFQSVVSGDKVFVDKLDDSQAIIKINSYELAHRIKGGTVRPIPPRRALAIPLTEEARAAGYPSDKRIRGVFRPKGTNVLAVKDGDGFRALWALVASVTHRPRPEDAVPEGVLQAAAEPVMRDAILRALRNKGNG